MEQGAIAGNVRRESSFRTRAGRRRRANYIPREKQSGCRENQRHHDGRADRNRRLERKQIAMAGPYNFESQPKSLRNLVLSANRQLAWNTALADAALTQRQRFDGGAIIELTPTRRSDIDAAGKGTAFATNGQVTSFDTKLSGLKFEGAPWILGFLCAFLMGKETVTGAAAPYTHAFAFDESTRTAVPTTT